MLKGYQPKTDNLARFYKWGMIKRRTVQKKYEIGSGKTFYWLKFGLRTIYVKRISPRKLWKFAG